MANNVFAEFGPQLANPFAEYGPKLEQAPAPPPKPEKTGMLRAAADIPVQVGRGVAVGVKALSDVFGADNPVSRAASGVEDFLGGLLSAQAKNDQAEIARIMKEAQDKGVGDQVSAAVKAFATAPVDMLSQALGTAVPVIAGGLAGSIARLGAAGVGAIGTGVGAAMGAGTVKGQIYDAVKQELLANKVPEAEAEKRAQEAQSYGGKNLDQILMGAGIGAAEAAFGAERILTGLLREGAVKPSTLPAKYRIPTAAGMEAVPEMAQAAQEQVAQNIALQREGYDVPTMRGVVGQAALEGIAGMGLGAITGAVQRTEAAKPEAEPPKPQAPAGPQQAEAEAPKPVTGEAGIVRPEEEVKPLTMEEQRELELQQRLYRSQQPKAEELLGEVRGQIQTAPPTTPADIARIRDDHETAVINSLLEQDRKMQSVSDLARLNLERMSQTESLEAATKDADRRVREGRLMGRVQSLIDQNIPFASTAIADINRKFEMIGEAPLDDTERARVQNIMTMAQGFTDFVKLPSLPVREQDRFAENQAMEALIKERKPRGQVSPQPVRAETPAPSPVVGQAPVSGRAEEGAAVRPEVSPEPGIAEDRQRAEPVEPVAQAAAPEPVATEAEVAKTEEVPSAPEAVPKAEIATGKESTLWRYNEATGMWNPQRKVTQETQNQWLNVFQSDDPTASFLVSDKRPKGNPKIVPRVSAEKQPAGEVRPEGRVQREGEGRAAVSDEEVKKSLRTTPAQQVSDFEQTLRTALNKLGLKDVGLKLINGMTEEGSYAQKLIQIAADSANPIRTLRHEAIHALRELGFFTPQQWQSLSKMAKDKWIDQYLKQRNIDGKPLKAGEESRYDAYMREYEGDMEKITEEAVADAFADFDATKPPAGLVSALLTRLRNLFQSIKSALTKVESPEQIFGKVERGELAAAGEARPADEMRKSLRKEGPKPNPTTAGQSALDTINQLGMGVQPPEPGKVEKIKTTLKNIGENPSLTVQEAKKKFGEWMDWFETKTFSADAKFEADVRRGLKEDMAGMEALIGTMLSVSQSGAVHADAVATQAVLNGRAEYDPETQKWVAVEDKNNITELSRQLEAIADKYGLTKEEAQRVAHTYFVAKNYNGILERNKKTQAQIDSLKEEGKKEEADDLKDTLIFVAPDQEALVEPGLELINQIPELGKMVETWTNIRQNFVKTLVSSYLWSPEYATAMLDNIDYVPFYREEQVQEEEGPQQMIRGLQVKSKEHKLKGSASPVNDVFDNMARWMQYAMNRAIRNHKALQMVDVATEMKVGDRMMAKKVSEPKRGMNVARVWRGGKQEFYDMADPLYVGAFQSLGAVSIPSIKFFTDISNILRKTVVMYPLFSIGQLTQDSVAAIFASGLKPQHAFKIPFLAVQEFIKTMKGWSTTHDELVKYGVVGVRDFNATVARQDAEITAGIKAPRGAWGKINYMLERIAMSADNAVRQATYIAATDAGLSKAESLEKAFEIINFRRRGSSKLLNLMGQTVPFFYAYLSAQRVAYKTLTGVGISPTERKAALETLAQTTAAVMALSFLYAMANGDDEEYKKTPATVRDRSLIIPGSGGVRIPLRPDFFLFPKVIAEHTYQLITDEGYSDGAKFRKSMADLFANATLSPNVVPQIVKPTFEAAINYSFFEGKPIIGYFEQNKEAGRQFNESTSEFAKWLGRFGASPQMVDHLVRGYFGSVGGLGLWGTNFFIEGEPGVPRPELTAHDMLTTMPGVGAFKQKSSENALKVDFYELRDAIAKAKNTYDDMKVRSPEGLEAFLQDEKNLARLAMDKQVTKVGDHLSKIRRAIQQVAAAPEERMSASEKQERIKELRDVEMELLKAVDVKAMRAQAKL